MSLSDYDFKTAYNKMEDDIATEFYLPCMRVSTRYDRISGYFGSTIYIIAWEALKDFITNKGKMRIICSPYISDEDQAAMLEGYSARTSEILADSIKKEVEVLMASPSLSAPARMLAYLVSADIVDVKIAVVSNGTTANIKRLFHDKVGVFCDDSGNAVGFRGSMNETYKGLSSDGNIESIDVFPNWVGDRDLTRLIDAQDMFERLWTSPVSGVMVYDFPTAAKEVLREKARDCNWEELLEEIRVTTSTAQKWKPDKRLGGKTPRSHQVDALEAWVKNSRRGIFEHATGSGKTFTAMCAIRDALEKQETVIVLVPSKDLLNQWYKELRQTITDIEVYYLLCGDGNIKWRQAGGLSVWTTPTKNQYRIILATMDTACSKEFLGKVVQGEHLFLVADELHRLGSESRRKALTLITGPRLGLSATPYRYGDAIGTAALLEYFGGIIPPPFTLDDAIKSEVLTHYFYHPQRLSLTPTEQAAWDEITEKISRIVARSAGAEASVANAFNNPRLKQLLINRARIIKNASGKVALAIDTLKKHFSKGQRWIIYCDNIRQLKAVLNGALAAGFDAYEYYAEMRGDRDMTLSYFTSNGGILISIKCLDEGVDIPSTTHALILASSQNPREFIQRRGRILRRSDNKHFAHLYDAITIPSVSDSETDKSLSIIMAELARAIQFGEGADNPACITDLKNIAIDFQIDYKKLKDGGIEDEEK